jgi:uncharacterized membrane protein YphA (DoxX/SURF4 family)
MLVRRIARPLLATLFVADGVDAVRAPEPHVQRVEAAYRRLSGQIDLPDLDHGQLRTLVRAHGAGVTVAALALALGRAPRTAALVLSLLTIPVAVVNSPVLSGGNVLTRLKDKATGAGSTGTASAAETPADADQDRTQRFLRNLTMIGATLIAAVDLEGRPGLAWRAGHARVDKAATKEARAAVAEARREVKAALKDARRVTA